MTKALVAAVTTEIAKGALQPIILISMTLTNATVLRYALFPADIEYDSNTYTGIGGELGGISESSSMEIGEVKVTLNNINRVFSAYVCALNPTELRGATIEIFRVYAGLLSDATAFEPMWEGTLDEWSIDGKQFTMVIKDWIATLWEEIPARMCYRACPWLFGGTYCTLTASATPGAGNYKQVTAQVADAGGSTTTLIDAARTEADNYWNNGQVTFTSGDNNGLSRVVKDFDNATATVTFEMPFPYEVAENDQYTIRQGCDHTPNTCNDRFTNMANYGGNLSVPRTSYR